MMYEELKQRADWRYLWQEEEVGKEEEEEVWLENEASENVQFSRG